MKFLFYSGCALFLVLMVKFIGGPGFGPAQKTVIDDLQALCGQLDKIKFSTEPCAVNVWSNTVTLVSALSTSESESLCYHIVKTARETNTQPATGWSVRIVSPYSDGTAIANCTF